MREYRAKGIDVKIDVPEDYAQSLDQVRALRLKLESSVGLRGYFSRRMESRETLVRALEEHPHGSRALPEDLIPFLENFPNRSYVKRRLISDWDSPNTAFYHQLGTVFKTAPASASPQGFIATHKLDASASGTGEQDLTTLMNHEWSHLTVTHQLEVPYSGDH